MNLFTLVHVVLSILGIGAGLAAVFGLAAAKRFEVWDLAFLATTVLMAQLFQKVPALTAMAPTQSEPPFLVSQVVVMALFAGLGVLAVKGLPFQPLHQSTAVS